jgi:hypothetical protein
MRLISTHMLEVGPRPAGHELRSPDMKLTRLPGTCKNGTCPTVYETDRGTYVVQGYVVTDAEALTALGLPSGEAAVEIPRDLLLNLVGTPAT